MKSEVIPEIKEFYLVGLELRTTNANEQDPNKAKIADAWDKFYANAMSHKIKNKINDDVIGLYSDYKTDENDEYTLTIGHIVDSFRDVPDGMTLKKVPTSKFVKFTTDKGKMPEVVINAWQKIWQMKEKDFGGKRNYLGDFEVYSKKAEDPSNAEIDIFIAID